MVGPWGLTGSASVHDFKPLLHWVSLSVKCRSARCADLGTTWAGGLVLPFGSCAILGNLLKLTEFPFPRLKSKICNIHFFRRLLRVLKMVYVKNLEQYQAYTKWSVHSRYAH